LQRKFKEGRIFETINEVKEEKAVIGNSSTDSVHPGLCQVTKFCITL
jgi:hypothetical protein